MKKFTIFLFFASLLLTIQCSYFRSDEKDEPVKNIIFLIGDGMGIVQSNAVRLQILGKDTKLNLDKMPVTGIVHTHSADDIITDSAASVTAMSTGYKTKNGMLAMNSDTLEVKTILEAAREKGMKTGLVATSGITHATPAGFASHVDNRGKYSLIAEQMLNERVDVMLGGGLEYFLPQKDPKSKREDDLNLIQKAIDSGYQILLNRDELAASNGDKLLGLFNEEGLKHESHEPTLAEMTQKALNVLEKSKNGFFIMVEGSQIDWAGHENNFEYMQREMMDFDEAIGVAVNFARKTPGTLVVVTADHETGGMVISGGDEKNVEISWASKHHSGTPVIIYSYGPHAISFTGVMDNTDIPKIMGRLLNLNNFPAIMNN